MIKQSLVNVAGGLVHAFLALLAIPILIRLIGVNNYGLWVFLVSLVMLIVYSEPGITVAGPVLISRDIANPNTSELAKTVTMAVAAMLAVGITAAIVLWVFAGPIVRLVSDSPAQDPTDLVAAVRWAAVTIAFRLMIQVMIGIEQGFQRYLMVNIIFVVYSISHHMLPLLVAFLGGTFADMMFALAASSFGILLLHVFMVRRLLRPVMFQVRFDTARLKELTRLALEAWPGIIGPVTFNRLDRILVGAVGGSQVLAVYSALTSVSSQISSLSSLLAQPAIPIVSRLVSEGARSAPVLGAYVRRSFGINALASTALSLVIVLASSYYVQYVLRFGRDESVLSAFVALTCLYLLFSPANVAASVLTGLKQIRICSAVFFVGSLVSLGLIIGLTRVYGLLGAVAGNGGFLLTLSLVPMALRRLPRPLEHAHR